MARVIRYLEDGVWKYASVKDVGDLEKLKTASKADVVSAINELVASGSAMGIELGGRVDGLEGQANELVQITGNVQEVLGQVQGELNDKVEKMYLDEQMNKLVSKEAYDANYQEIKGELLDKVDITKYDAEYNEVTNRLKEKADLSAFNGVEGRVSTTEQEITNVKGELNSKVGKTEYDGAVGLNRWIARRYNMNIGSTGATPSFEHIKGKQPNEIIDYDDNVKLQPFTGDYYIGHYFTNIYMKVAKTVTLNVTHDDGAVIYMNGAKMYEGGTRTTALSVPMTFRAGWNTVEILHYEHSGTTEHVTLGVKLSTQVDKMTSVIGVGDKNETRLTQAETEIKQTSEAIKLKAEGSEVTQLGNRVTTNEGSISVMQNEIKSLVKSEDFNKYTGRLETAESTILQHSNQINQKVEKTEHDALNNIVKNQQTSINQLTDEIDLKATKSEYDGLNGRVGNAETQINLNTEAIKLKAEKTELDKTNGRLQKAESQLTVQAGEIASKVTQQDINKSIDDLSFEVRNLILNSGFARGFESWNNTSFTILPAESDKPNSKIVKVSRTGASTNNIINLISNKSNVKNGDSVSFSVDFKVTSFSAYDVKNPFIVEFYDDAGTRVQYTDVALSNIGILTMSDGKWVRLTYTTKANNTSITKVALRLALFRNGEVFYREPQMQIGTKATGYMLAPEDSLGAETRLANAESTIVQHATEIGLKANANDVYKKTEADGKVSTAITQAKGEIKIETDKISQNVTNLTQTVTTQGTTISNHETSITQMKGDINLRAEAKNVYTKTEADGKISTAVTNAKAEIAVTTNSITQTVTNVQNDLKGVKDTVVAQGTQIKQTSDEVAINVVKKGSVKASINASTEGVKIGGQHVDITGQVTFQSLDSTMQGKVNAGTDAKNTVDNMSVGGRNILFNTGNFNDTTGWVLNSGTSIAVVNKDGFNVIKGVGSYMQTANKTKLKPDTEYVYSGEIMFEQDFPINDASPLHCWVANGGASHSVTKTVVSKDKVAKANTWTRIVIRFKTLATGETTFTPIIYTGSTMNTDKVVSYLKNIQLEEGNIATTWQPAPEDVQANIDNITIGANNFISNSLFKTMGKWRAFGTTGGTKTAGVAVDLEGFPTGFQFESVVSGEYGLALDNIKLTKGETYTLSAWIKLTKAGVAKVQEGNSNVGWTHIKSPQEVGKWVRVVHTFVAKDTSTSIYAGADASSPATAGFVTGVQLERGNKVTDWRLSQSDIDEAIAIVQGNVDNITIGGSNLLLNSHADYSTTDYLIATYTLTENWVAGQEYTFVIKGTVPAGQKFGIWMNGGSNNVGYATTRYVDGVTYVTFKAVTPAGSHTKSLSLYNYPQNTTTCTVDWVALYRGNKPMDWQISSGDVQNLFTGADEKAEASKRAIADMSNDNKATSIEKQQLKKEWATITAEKPNYEALATTYGITTEKTNYVNSYNALNTAITPIIANTTVTSDINGATFRATFDDYYDKKSQLIKKINELARSIGTGADSKAQSAQNAIADMSSDSKITPVEKVQLKKEWAVMLSEKPQYEALGTTYGVTTEKTNYVNAYNTLNTVLNGTGGILTNMTTTSAVTGATFRGQFDDYYDKKAQLVKKINEMSKSLADSAQGTANTANSTANTANNAINSNKAVWDRASNINSNGTFNSNKLSGLILDAQISSAVNWNGAKSLLDSWKSGTTLINGGMIATNTIFAQQIAIGDFTNLSQINEEKNPNGYPTVLLSNKRFFKIGNGAYASLTMMDNTYVEFKVNDEYYIAFNGYRDSGLTSLNLIMRYHYTDGTWANAGAMSALPTTSDTRIIRNLKITTAPDDTKTISRVQLFFEKDGTAGSGYYYIRDLEVRKRYTGELIVDGSIKAQQLDVASLFAHSGFITSLKSQEINADKITGGTIKGIRYESINASNKTIKLVLEGNTIKSYGAMDTTTRAQNYSEMKEGGISVFEMAENGSPFGDRKAYVEPARFNARQGSSYSVALEPTELRFWVPNMFGKVTFDVAGEGEGYGLILESVGGVRFRTTGNSPAFQFDNKEAVVFDKYGNIRGGSYSTSSATWSIIDADGRMRLLVPVGKGTQVGNEYHSHAGGHKFFYNGSLGLSTYVQGGDSPIIQFNGRSILKYWGGGNYFEFKNQWDSGFVPVYASAFNTASSLIWKTDIESYEKSALDVVMGTNIVTYKYKSDVEESDNPHTHVGVIAEYAPKEIQSKDGRGVDNYAMSSLAWKAIQELSEQVRYLKEKLNNR
ncbi:tail fiber domain-containing protein [Bacillus cereus]|uniref:Tail fiber domain-containing protein n=1 Tax=Bacillus cereus TaxID=1396 RepID=A0ABD4LMY5_BACCE|nr:tail fiber domain-containing protein [Bacillus cereus]MBK1611789.1 tail fiber domain-containing protein [Bacillus cereus]